MKKILGILIPAMIFLGGCDERNDTISSEQNFAPYKVDEQISLKSVSGDEITIKRTNEGFKLANSDKLLMFDIFATYCEPCKAEAAHLTDLINKNKENMAFVGLITFEEIENHEIIENFMKKYGAYYFIANEKENDRLIAQILNDIKYNHALSIPFKVLLQNGKYANLTDFNEGMRFKKYYLGAVPEGVIENDLQRLK